MDPSQDATASTHPDHDRSGETVVDSVENLAEGTQHQGVVYPPDEAEPGGSPVEQTGGDAAMTQGQVVDGPGQSGSPVEVPSGQVPEAPMSGGAQSMPGGRVSDRVAAAGGGGAAGDGAAGDGAAGDGGGAPGDGPGTTT